MKIKHFYSELEAMRTFYDELKITPNYDCNTDGRVKGTLIEIKLNSTNIPFKQLKKYINAYNSLALPIPQYSLFISFNQRKFTFINNKNEKIITKGKWDKATDLLKFLNKKDYIKGWINEFSIVSYNDLFYKNNLSTKKENFIKEIKNPKTLNIQPYNWNKTGNMERDILDCLGSTELKKRLGAFFTPDKYVKISTEYLRNAIKRVPEGYDYIILDRCAGTGNLEKFLTNDELSHCILNTFVYAEWTTLKGVYGDRVRYIIPHTKKYKDNDGLLSDGDALSEKFNNQLTKIINKEKDKVNGKLIVIGLENPPYAEPGSKNNSRLKTSGNFINKEMKKDKNVKGRASTDLSNQFIWSMTKLYANEYIVYSPIKYWKTQKLLDKKFNKGYLCNREKFHATKASISLISWIMDKKYSNEWIEMQSDLGNKIVKKIKEGIGTLVLKSSDKKKLGEVYFKNGEPTFLNGVLCNKEMNKNACHRLLGKDNIKNMIPLWVTNCYKYKDYTENGTIFKSGDGGIKYQADKNFLNDCFIWSCLSQQNKCISDSTVKNELCLCQNTKADKLLNIEQRHTTLLEKWEEILKIVKTTDEYNPNYTYGFHQIIKEINIKIKTGGYTKKNEPIMEHKYTELNSLIKNFKEELKIFYDKYLTPKLFKYELLK